MYERFTDRARKVMQLANHEAQHRGAEYITVGHLMVGLVREGSGVAANVLKNCEVNLDRLRDVWMKLCPSTGALAPLEFGRLPHTPALKAVIQASIEEATGLRHNYVGTEHLLLGAMRDPEAAKALAEFGLTVEGVREEIVRLVVPKPAECSECDRLRRLVVSMAERIERQSALLSQRAEKTSWTVPATLAPTDPRP